MSTPVIFNWGSLPAGFAPKSWDDLIQQIAKIASAHVQTNYTTFNWGSSTPSAEDQDKPWVKTNVDGSPDGVYFFFNGVWCRPHPIPASSTYYRALWFGTAEQLRSFDGGDGTADAPTEFSGAMWEIDSAYPASFLCTPGAFTNAGTLAVAEQLTGTGVAGADEITLTLDQIPSHTHTMTWDRQDAGGGNQSNVCYDGTDNGATEGGISKQTGATGGTSGTTEPHNNLPPFVGVYLIKRTVRKYYTL